MARQFDSHYEVADLLALAEEIHRVEKISRDTAMCRAVAQLPQCVSDYERDLRYRPCEVEPVGHVVFTRVYAE